ncbi:hypothetical protein F511_25673 [Dorcoceras hygrometricum]|uniref:Uncharacterized protein n=1 Tax=Dorcoceras hygrometricum TaxID=472368 RepID=A0A2Z7AJE7_9LAMI|nr:hypothetical protein F511_25673 [Dorcoceras hygrometricum]
MIIGARQPITARWPCLAPTFEESVLLVIVACKFIGWATAGEVVDTPGIGERVGVIAETVEIVTNIGDVEKQNEEPTTDVVVKELAMEIIAEKEAETSVDDVDSNQQTLADIAQLETDVGEPGITDAEEQVGLRTDTIPKIVKTIVDGTVVGEQMVQRSDETENRTDISFAEFVALDFQVFTSETDRMFETGSESENELEMSASKQPGQIFESGNRVVESASAAYLVEEPIEETEHNQGTEIADVVTTADTKISDDESMTLEEHLSMIPDGSSLPYTTGEVTKIQFGKSITIRGVDEGDCFKRLAALKIEDIYAKEEQVLSWAETDSTRITLQWRMYILTKYRELLLRKFLEARKKNFVPGQSSSAIDLKILAMLSNLHIFVLEELKTEMQAHGLIWEMTCCSRIFEGPNRDRGAVIARSNANIRSSCWIRTMIRVDGSLVIEPCADYWKPLPRRLFRNEILTNQR